MSTNMLFLVSMMVPLACGFVAWLLMTAEGEWKKVAKAAAWLVIAYGALFVFFAIQRLYGHE